MTHPFDKYLQRHGHYPRARLDIGGDKYIEVQLAPSYIIVSSYPYGRPLFIPRITLIKLLRWLVPLVRHMHGNFSVEDAISQNTEMELEHLEALRRQKHQRYGSRSHDHRRTRR